MKRRFGVISLYSIIDFCFLYIGISSVFPRINGYLDKIDTTIVIALNIILLIIAFTKSSKCFGQGTDALLLIIFLLYSIAIPYLAGNTVMANRYLVLLFFLVAPHIISLYEQNKQLDRLKKISIVISIFAVITFITTTLGLLTNPYLARSIKSSGEITSANKKLGIGGYEFVYYCMILGVALFDCFWQKRKLWFLVGTITLFGFILLSNYMTAVFLFAIGCLICLFSARNTKQRIAAFAIIIIILFFSDNIIGNISNILQSISPRGRISSFMTSYSGGLIRGIVSEFINDRLPTLEASWYTIIDSFGLGVIFSNEAQIGMLGQHSFLLDSLAIFGIPMGILYFYLLFKKIKLPTSCLVTFFILTLVNNITNSLGVAVYLIIPILTKIDIGKQGIMEIKYG